MRVGDVRRWKDRLWVKIISIESDGVNLRISTCDEQGNLARPNASIGVGVHRDFYYKHSADDSCCHVIGIHHGGLVHKFKEGELMHNKFAFCPKCGSKL